MNDEYISHWFLLCVHVLNKIEIYDPRVNRGTKLKFGI